MGYDIKQFPAKDEETYFNRIFQFLRFIWPSFLTGVDLRVTK